MAKAKRRRAKRGSVGKLTRAAHERRDEIIGFLLIGASLLLFLSLVSYDRFDTRLHTSTPNEIARNVCGLVGAYLAEGLFFPFGLSAFFLPGALAYWAWRRFFGDENNDYPIKLAGLAILMVAFCGIMAVYNVTWNGKEFQAGGLTGYWLDYAAQKAFGTVGSKVLMATFAFVGLLLTTDLLLFSALRSVVEAAGVALQWAFVQVQKQAPHVGAWLLRQLATLKQVLGALVERARIPDTVDDEAVVAAIGMNSPPPRPRGKPRIFGAQDERAEEEEDERLMEVVDYGPLAPGKSGAAPGDGILDAWDHQEEEVAKPRPRFTGRFTKQPQADELEEIVEPRARKKPADIDIAQLDFMSATPAAPKSKPKRKWGRKRKRARTGTFELPDVEMFTASKLAPTAPTREEFEQQAAQLEAALETFNIEAEVLDVVRGPTVTRFELRLAPGIKVSKVLALSDDLALSMKALRVRIEAPIPGRGTVGIEIPNQDRDEVRVRDIIESDQFKKSESQLSLALGKDIAGDPVVIDLAAMPHLLIAGATGAGKTVCVNTLISSLLTRSTPNEVRLMLIDPKMVELSQYDGIPHLLWPVVTDAKEAGKYLGWLVREMEKRYEMLAKARTRNIAGFNALAEENLANGESGLDEEGEPDPHTPVETLPYIVAVIDELADLMMVSAKEVEDAVARLAQLARAVGIHLVLATQRPSVDVLTGVIKANFPARISFAVRSKVDSRTVLDGSGAEQLIGNGDLLYLPAGQARPIRVQGAYVSDKEIEGLVDHLNDQGEPEYLDAEVELSAGLPGEGDFDAVDDDLYPEAVKLVLTGGQASISMLQRRLRVGYARAARLVDMMELQGIVGPGEGSKPRELLVGLEFLERLNDPHYV